MTKNLGTAYFPALRGKVGKWYFYSTLMTFSEIRERIKQSDDIREIYDNKKLSQMVQRAVVSSRAAKIAEYLTQDEDRFFPSLVVAVYKGSPRWYDFDIEKKNKNIDFDTDALSDNKLESFGFLALSGDEEMFPLDGQHRLAGICKALDDCENVEVDLSDEEATVLLLAHNPNSEKGRIRSRRLFTLLNKRAVPVKKHEIIALDEDDVMAIATRHIVENFAPLSKDNIVSVSAKPNFSYAGSPDYRNSFAAIVTIYDILFELFKAISRKRSEKLKFYRPDDKWLEVYKSCAECFFCQMLETFPEVRECLTSSEPAEEIAKYRHENGGHLLFRPVGQNLLSRLVSEVVRTTGNEVFERDDSLVHDAKDKAIKAIKAAFKQFEDLPTDLAGRPYKGLIWESETRKIRHKRITIVKDIILRHYELLRQSDKNLTDRLVSAIGPENKLADFEW